MTEFRAAEPGAELIGAKLKDGAMAYFRPDAVLGLIPSEDGMQLLLVGGTKVTLLGSGGTLRRRLMGQPEPAAQDEGERPLEQRPPAQIIRDRSRKKRAKLSPST